MKTGSLKKLTNKLEDLPDKVYQLFDPDTDHIVSEDNLDTFCTNLKEGLRSRLRKQEERGGLRFSSLGKKDRQLWYEAKGYDKEKLTGKTFLKFQYGHVIEELLLFLIKEAGYEVDNEQAEVECNGVLGHTDCTVNGIVVDVKSASPYGFQKFKNGTVIDDDPFGYIQQLSGYSTCLTPGEPAAFIAFDKVSGEICVSEVGRSIITDHPPGPRIDHLKTVIDSDIPPERCYEPVEMGKSGNMKLPTGCSYCAFKASCWPEARMFIYSSGPVWLSKVVKTPDVYEVVDWK